jgi:hypothetical protein
VNVLDSNFSFDTLTTRDKLDLALKLQNYVDSSFRLIVFVYSLTLALLAFSKGMKVLVIFSCVLVLMVLIYGFYILASAGPLLTRMQVYSRFHLVFYYIEIILLVMIFLSFVYYYVSPFRDSPNASNEVNATEG